MTETQAARKPIIATAIYEQWNQHDILEELRRVDFDATHILAGLTPEQRLYLMHGGMSAAEIGDDIFREAEARGLIPTNDSDGPFSLEVTARLYEALQADPEYFSHPLPEGREVRHEDALLETPLTPYEQGYRSGEDYSVSGLVTVSMSDLHDNDFEGHLDNVAVLLTGNELLMEIQSSAKRVTSEGDLVMLVSGVVAPGECFDVEGRAEFDAGREAAAEALVAE